MSADGGADVPGTYPAWTLAEDHGDRLRFAGMFLGVRVDDLDSGVWMADIGPITVAFSEPNQHWSSET